MATLLQIDSSGLSKTSVTRRLSAEFTKKWLEANPGAKVVHRDLLETKLPFANEALIFAMNTPPEDLTAAQKMLLALPDEFMKELQEADTLVIGAPMYNFSIPAALKAYIDAIVRPGLTFSFEGGYPKGLLKNKSAIIVTASGGDYSQPPMKAMDYVEPYLRSILGFIGITDVTFVKAHGNDPDTKSATEQLAIGEINNYFNLVAAR